MKVTEGRDTLMLLHQSKTLLKKSGLSVGHVLIDCEKGETVERLMNVDHKDRVIQQGIPVGLTNRAISDK